MKAQTKANARLGLFLALLVVVTAVAGALIWRGRFSSAPATANGEPGVEKTPSTPEQSPPQKDRQPEEPPKVVLRSSLAGAWYSADADTLNRQFESFAKASDARPIDNVIALILPHAGYRFSGPTAVSALKSTSKQYKRIIVIGPSHRMPIEEILCVPEATHYQTPLGQIPLDTGLIGKLREYALFQGISRAFEGENSVELELPLLQHFQKDFKLVPIVAGRCSQPVIERAAAILKSFADSDTLIVASSDFVHYGRTHDYVPFTQNIPEQIKKLDMGAYEHIARLDSSGFTEYRRKTGATICGSVPIAILPAMLPDGAAPHLVKYTTSGELTGDFTNSVSYLSVAFSGTWAKGPRVAPLASRAKLAHDDKKALLSLARKTIPFALEHRRVPEPPELGVNVSDSMSAIRGAFVTLKKNGRLRGCIGDIFPQRPLYKSVIMNALNAAFNDRRFPQVTSAECGDITIEISALTPPQPVGSYKQIRIGTDGVVLKKSGRSAVFLPQVATEQGWSLDQTLTQLSLKAALPSDAWKQGAEFLVFQADVFGEGEK